MSKQYIHLAVEKDIDEIDMLLCSARKQIGLTGKFCAIETRPKRIKWLKEKIAFNLLWIIRDSGNLNGVLILEQDLFERVVGIAYIVVAEGIRGRREIGPQLVRKAQALAGAGFLEAEARNDHSRRLLETCGFQCEQQCSGSGHPVLRWSRS